MRKVLKATAIASSFFCLAGASQASLSITNGDFETGGGANILDVTDWYDWDLNDDGSAAGGFWQGAWQSNAQSFNGTNQVVFSSFQSDNFSAPTPDVNDGSYLYQSIGTADGLTSVDIKFDWGAPTDDNIARDLGITVGIYAYDGIGGFVAGENVDARGGAGVTLLDSVTFTSAANTRPAGGTMFTDIVATLDLTGAGTQELFLRFNGYLPSTTESWPTLDNVSIVPEPASLALMGLGGLMMLRRRRG